MTRKALGRGLSALLHEVESTTTGLDQIHISLIDPNPYQPRRRFPDTSLRELAESIRATGVVQPVLVRRADSRYQLVAGERRWRAARLAGLETIPGLIRDLSDREALELALTENLLREDLNPIDVARGFDALQKKFNLGHEEIADRMGINRSTVSNTLRLLRLPASVQDLVASGEISHGHARALLGLESEADQVKLAKRIVRKGFSVRQVETLVAVKDVHPPRAAGSAAAQLDANTRAALLEMQRTLGTKVRVKGTANRGTIEISYFSSEDLNRIYDWIVRQ